MKKICIIDNYDSFTYNIVHLIEKTQHNVTVLKNNCFLEDILKIKPDKLILSPGPGSPKESGICSSVLAEFIGKIDILGICLGHQIIAEYFGNKVDYAKKIMHGKVSQILHTGFLFSGIPQNFNVARYHSLAIKEPINNNIQIIARACDDDEIMAIKHPKYNVFGVQFHPESFLTEFGEILINNFINKL